MEVDIISASAKDVRIRGGAIIQNYGRANLINNVVIVKKNFTDVNFLREKAKEMEDRLAHLKENEPDEKNKVLLENMKEKLGEITGSRKKRSLLPFVGTALNKLFGVATESDIQKEKERLDKIEDWAHHLGNMIDGTVDVLENHAMVINDITNALNLLSSTLETDIDHIERQLVFNSIALKIDEIVNDVRFKMDALLEAKLNRVSVNLITFSELEEIIRYAIINFMMKPLEIDIISYYNVMSVKVVNDQVYVLLPFDNEKNMKVYKVTPFPMIVKGQNIMLDSDVQIVLEKERTDLIALWKEIDFFNSCVEINDKEFVCNHDLFYTQHIHNIPCVDFLLNNGNDACLYKIPTHDFEVKLIDNDLYLYTRQPENLIVNCNGKEHRMTIENVNKFPRHCYLKISTKFYYEPPLFREINVNDTFHNYDFQLNLEHIMLPKVENIAETMPHGSFLYTYRERVMPVMTLIYYPLVIVLGVIAVLLFRKK